MLRNLWTVLALTFVAATFVAVGCGPSGDDDDSGPDPAGSPVITDLSPGPGDSDFFYQSDLWVEWNIAPEGATYALSMGGTAVAGTTATKSSGRVLTFTPDAALDPAASYSSTVSWNSPDSPLTFDFQTGAYGNSLTTENDLLNKTFNLDLANAEFVEPPGVGPILQSQIGDVAILFSVTDDSNFSANELHILGAVGTSEGVTVSQDLCGQTLGFTYGPDGALGGGDDVPASWNNPVMEMGPTNLSLNFQGIEATIQDLNITGTFHPDLTDMRGGTFSGRIDTRPLAPELDPEGGEGAICDLVVETVGVKCEECGGDNPGVFCLSIVAENVNADRVAETGVEPRACEDIIADAATCPDEAAVFDPAADLSYTDCPAWSATGDDDDSAGDDDDSAGDDDDSAGDDDDSASQ